MIETVFAVLAPILALGLIGFIATRAGYFQPSHREGLTKYVFDVAVPMLLFSAIVELKPPQASTADLFLSYYSPLWTVFVIALVVAWRILNRPLVDALVISLGASFSNAVLLGIPLIPRALGEEALFPLFLLISVHGITVFTVVTVAIEVAKGRDAGLTKLPMQVAKGLLSNPLIVALALGFTWKITGIGLHPIVLEMFNLAATSITPAALFVLGSSLASYHVSGSVAPAILITILKNLVHPALVFAVGSFLQLDTLWLSVAVLLAAMPTGMNLYLFAHRYQVPISTATTSIFVSTVAGIGTLSLTIAFVQSL
jgi:malonate transporter and related proteins